MHATLSELHYCRTYTDRNNFKPSFEQNLFVQVVCAIVVLNLIGTAYDMMTRDAPEKNKLLTAWSIPANWNRLTYISKESDPRIKALMPMQGARIAGLALIMFGHARAMLFMMYTSSPEELEGVPASRPAPVYISMYPHSYNVAISSSSHDVIRSVLRAHNTSERRDVLHSRMEFCSPVHHA
ncbi:hypothetical protein O3G_MSEX014727 [Manduca sexta]|uniref:Uncharacterized protein n=1 Tax=Manduca sexta TaxID=7130 RepID=A0A921ZWE7_MANSE|nr:hypothetical protein O3G_MSEX014727 [Manduca sexta]